MRQLGIGRYKTIGGYVTNKLKEFGSGEISFKRLFELMFSEKSNIMYEKSVGYKIVSYTYGEVYQRIIDLSARLKEEFSFLPADSVIGLYMDNSLEWIELFWAIICSSHKPLLMNLRLDVQTLEKALADSRAAAVVSDGKTFSVKTCNAAGLIASVNATDAPLPDGPFGTELFVMSSGTSSHVKICTYSAEQLYHQIEGSVRIISKCRAMKRHYDNRLKQLAFLPFYHVFGLIAVYIWFSFFSRTFVQLNDLSPQTIVNTIRRHHVTHIFAVPLFWEKVYAQAMSAIDDRGEKTRSRFMKAMKIRAKLGDFPILGKAFSKIAFRELRENLFGDSISFMISGGSVVSEEVLTFFNDIGYHLANGFGMTEISISSVELSTKRSFLTKGYIGKPMYGLEYKIDDKGELQVRGKSLAPYIIVDGERIKNDGWYHTNDLAEVFKGHYKVLGRSDDLIIASNGENVNPNLVECRLNVPGAKEVCLIGACDGGETVPTLLVSVDRTADKEKLDAIDAALKEQIRNAELASFVRKIVYVTDPLILDNEFKLNRKRLSAAYNSGKLHPADPSVHAENEVEDEISFAVKEYFAAALQRDVTTISADCDFFLDCGGTSLDYFAMITGMNERFSISFPTEEGRSLSTVRQFCEYIKAEGRHVDKDL